MSLVGSLKRFKQVKAITITPEGKIVAGHHLVMAATELGWTHIGAMPNEFADDDERLAYLVADNALSQLGGYDEQAQLTLLEDLASRQKLEGTGLTLDDVEDMRARMDAVPETQAPETWGGGYAEDAEAALARAEGFALSKQKKEVLMMMELTEYEQFGEDIRELQGYLNTTGVKDTVVAAVRKCAALKGLSEVLQVGGAEEDEDVALEVLTAEDDPLAPPIPAPTFDGEIPVLDEGQTSLLDDVPDPE